MIAVNAVRTAARVQPTLVHSTRQMSVVSGPPQVRISPAEKAVHAAAIAVGILGIPAWVLVNIKNYRANE